MKLISDLLMGVVNFLFGIIKMIPDLLTGFIGFITITFIILAFIFLVGLLIKKNKTQDEKSGIKTKTSEKKEKKPSKVKKILLFIIQSIIQLILAIMVLGMGIFIGRYYEW